MAARLVLFLSLEIIVLESVTELRMLWQRVGVIVLLMLTYYGMACLRAWRLWWPRTSSCLSFNEIYYSLKRKMEAGLQERPKIEKRKNSKAEKTVENYFS